jgi:hypothetical protein
MHRDVNHTLKEQAIHGRVFQNIEEVRVALIQPLAA